MLILQHLPTNGFPFAKDAVAMSGGKASCSQGHQADSRLTR